MNISILTGSDVECDAFVKRMADGKLEYLPAWSFMVERTFGHRSFYLTAHKGDAICGVLPLMYVRSRLFGNRMISQAFSNYGGPLVDCKEASDALIRKAIEIAENNDCQVLELHNVEAADYDLHLWLGKITLRVPLMSNPDELWRSFKSKSKVRNHVRKAEEFGLSSVSGQIELLDEFYRIWTVRMRQLGTPCYSIKLFQAILETFPDNTRVFLAKYKDRTVGVRFTTIFNDLVLSRWGATLTEYNHMRVNHLLYWIAMKYYCEAGAKWFDFGRSTVDSSQHKFKKQWGAIEIPLHYQYWTRPGHELFLAKPDNPKYKKKVELWKKLPLWMTRLVGPYISRNLP